MLKWSSAMNMLVWNIMIATVWHVVVFIACVKLPKVMFDCKKERYRPLTWEHGGRWYKDKLKIQLWKDKVPQHIGKDGFSKEHLTNVTLEYLDEFILETCRGEWMHFNNCICIFVTLLINPLIPGIIFSILILLGNLPFALIQRYNRFRLFTLRKKLIRDKRSSELNSDAVIA